MVRFILDPGGSNETILDGDEIVQHSPVKVHTGLATLRAEVATTTDLLPFAQRRDRLNVELGGSVEWTGYITKPGQESRTGTQRIKAFGIAKRLEETRPAYENLSNNEVNYSQIALQDAIDDYWSRTPFTNYSVTDQSTEILDSDADIQSIDTQTEWNDVTSINPTEPLYIDSGKLKLGQSAYFSEAEASSGSAGGVNSNTDASDGSELLFLNSGQNASYTFNLDYTIPASNVGVAVRFRNTADPDNDGTFENAGIDAVVDGTTVSNIVFATTDDNFEYNKLTSYSGGDISGTVNVDITVFADAPSGASTAIDTVVLYDTRFNYDFDNSVDANGYLSGPELYPTTQTTTLSSITTQFNIDSLEHTSTINDTSNGQQIELSNDGGTNFLSASNTDSFTANFTSSGRTAQVRLTLDGYGARTTATPTERFNGQEVDSFDLDGALDNLVVVDELALTNNHFENLQQLHSYGNFLWVIEHSDKDIRNLTVTSFREGDETRSAPSEYSDPIDKTSSVDVKNYYNKIFLRGAKDSNGDYPTATAEDTDEITDVGETIELTAKDPKITTDAGAQFRAQSLLAELTDENDRKGEITIPLRASVTHPGYARQIDFGDGEKLKTIERVQLTESQDRVAQTHQFAPPDDLSTELRRLKRSARDVRDTV